MLKNYRVYLGFSSYADGELDDATTVVITGLTGNAAFTTLPVSLLVMAALQATFRTSVAACAQGGTLATSIKRDARAALLDALRKNAAYVQSIANNDLPKLLSSGYEANSTNRASAPLDTPAILSISNSATRELTVQAQPVANAKAYEVQFSTSPGVWVHASTFPNSRCLRLTDLTPGNTYTLKLRAVGGSTGFSNWSDPVSHMAL